MPLEFDENDQSNIRAAIVAGGKIWNNDCIRELKQKIKNSFLNEEVPKCCYCSRSLKGDFKMVIDIEHILPQRYFPTEIFTINNINISCKRCNMSIKGFDTSFIVNIPEMGKDYYKPHHYKIIHPNLDKYSNHIVLLEARVGDKMFVKYHLKNNLKAKFTYDYFKLKELEIDAINNAQRNTKHRAITPRISANLKQLFEELMIQI